MKSEIKVQVFVKKLVHFFFKVVTAHLHTPVHLQLQMASWPEKCFRSCKIPAYPVRLALWSSCERLDTLARLAPRSSIFLKSAESAAALSAISSRAELFFNDFGNYQVSRSGSCVVTHIFVFHRRLGPFFPI